MWNHLCLNMIVCQEVDGLHVLFDSVRFGCILNVLVELQPDVAEPGVGSKMGRTILLHRWKRWWFTGPESLFAVICNIFNALTRYFWRLGTLVLGTVVTKIKLGWECWDWELWSQKCQHGARGVGVWGVGI